MRRFLTLGLAVSCLVLGPGIGTLEAQSTDSDSPEPLFGARDALWAGAFVLGTAALAPVDLEVADAVRDSLFQENPWLRATARGFGFLGVPGSIVVGAGMYALGQALDRPALADLGLHATEAIVIAEAVTLATKSLAGRARPRMNPEDPYDFGFGRGFRDGAYRSLPSGHSTAVFATAAAVTSEVDERWEDLTPWVGGALYSAAAVVAVSRLYHNEHWASDVMLGAAIGTFAGWKVVRYTHDRPRNRVDRLLLGVSIEGAGSARAARLFLAPGR